MRLAVNLVYEGAGELARTAEELGYAIAFAPEGYRSDAATVLGYAAARTERIALCGGVMQLPARPPGLAALTIATLDALSGGRAVIGLGVSNPDVSQGWYGVPFDAPLARIREYVEILRLALTGRPVEYRGEHFRLPADGPAQAPLHLMTRPLRADIPVYLAAIGPRNLRLAGEIGEGWIGAFASPRLVKRAVDTIGEGRRAAGRDRHGFDVVPCVPTAVAADPRAAADVLRPHFAHLMGIGSADRNIYCKLARELGYEDLPTRLHERIESGDRTGAAAVLPFDFLDDLALLGPVDRVADRMRRYAEAGATTLGIMVSAAATDTRGRVELLRRAAEALDRSGLAG